MKTILVVEDERVIAEILSAVLQDEGYDVVIADNGQEGLARIAEVRPDLVLCDVMMPILDGRDVARAMASHNEYRSIPLVMMSAATLPNSIRNYTYAEFIHKPFDMGRLLSTISRILSAA